MTSSEVRTAVTRWWGGWWRHVLAAAGIVATLGGALAAVGPVGDTWKSTVGRLATISYVDQAVAASTDQDSSALRDAISKLATAVDTLDLHVSGVDLNTQITAIAQLKAQRAQIEQMRQSRPDIQVYADQLAEIDTTISDAQSRLRLAQCDFDKRVRPWLTC